MFTARYDEQTGIVHTRAEGLTTIAQFEDYAPVIAAMLEKSRRRHGGFRHLLDAAGSSVQSRDVFDHMARATEGTMRPEDRAAIVLESMLLRVQLKRMMTGHQQSFFTDIVSAEAWLLDRAAAA